jgi:hypothetical protein
MESTRLNCPRLKVEVPTLLSGLIIMVAKCKDYVNYSETESSTIGRNSSMVRIHQVISFTSLQKGGHVC